MLAAGCVAGALEETAYVSKLAAAGFEEIEIDPTRIYRAEDAIASQVDGKFMSAFIRAKKL